MMTRLRAGDRIRVAGQTATVRLVARAGVGQHAPAMLELLMDDGRTEACFSRDAVLLCPDERPALRVVDGGLA